ncbi:hypothetical protein BCR35DRAFT_193473 [Leucosporidium creatinivorum]|uniref:Uncharacterized protein n=1 Tax=Leucosporidium creatinivorum TaxID=106004 RepID=A0A1Y2G111_9BASI|nr:hypothetical protein BCR35DRAFT_193473 [Leucosporidium creatinivorum]
MREVGSFHNEDFPGSNTGTFRKADMFGWRIFLSSWVNLGIDWESPKPGEPCVMLNAMKQDTKGIWVDSRWLELAREHLNSGAPIGVVVAAANSIANPADGGGKQRVPLGRYIVRDMGSAPAGAFSRASKEGRDAALASLRQHAIKSLDWSIQRAGLFRNTDLKELTTNAKAGSEDFMEHLGKELDNSKQDQHLTYTILEYHSPYDQAELEVAKEERRTGVKKAAMTAARKATRVRNAEQKKAGTYVPKRKGKKKVVDPPPESDSEESDSAQRSEWESAREEVSEESDESEEDEDDSYED